MLFFDPNSKHLRGAKFDCSTCHKHIQKVRGCRIDSYELTQEQMSKQIQLLEHGVYHKFCPSKLYRDNPELVSYFESLFIHYKTGIDLEKLNIMLTSDVLTDLSYLIILYESYVRMEQYRTLGKMLGGDNKKES